MSDPYKREEEYIIKESSEINIGENIGLLQKLKGAFPAFRYRNYTLYFNGQLVSLIGTWLQMVALGWLVLQITHSAFWVGTISALGSIPVLFFTLFAGVIIDHFPKKNILIFTQICSMILAFILGGLAILHTINLWEIAVLSFALGLVNALDVPTRQAFVVDMVGKEDLSSAISLNSATFNGARVVGPAVAGALIAIIGTGGAFVLNGVSFIAVIIALLFIRVKNHTVPSHLHPIASIKEGLRYSFSHKTIRTLLLFATITSIFGWSYSAMMPVIADQVYHVGASGLGFLNAANGLGAVLSTVVLSLYSKRISQFGFIAGGNTLFAVCLLLFSFTHSFPLALLLLFLSGLGLLCQFATINTAIQELVPDEFRGRVMSIYTLMFLGMIPFGSFEIGLVSEKFGPLFAIGSSAVITLIGGIFLIFNRKRLLAL